MYLARFLIHTAVISLHATNRVVFQMEAQCYLRDTNRIFMHNVDTFRSG